MKSSPRGNVMAGMAFVAAGLAVTSLAEGIRVIGGTPSVTAGVSRDAPAAASALPFTVVRGYFVKNTHPIPEDGISVLKLETQESFDGVFQKTPPLMNAPRTPPVAMEGSVVFAIIYRCHSVPEIKMTSVSAKGGAVDVSYTLAPPPPSGGTATFHVPLIVRVDRAALDKAGGARTVRFIENGKVVKTLSP